MTLLKERLWGWFELRVLELSNGNYLDWFFIFDKYLGGFAPEESGGGCDAGRPRFWHWYTCDGADGTNCGYWWVRVHWSQNKESNSENKIVLWCFLE